MKAILYFMTLFLLATYLCFPIMDPDLFWHIVVGRWITSNLSFPTQDYWNLHAFGKDWIAYSWFSEVLYSNAEKFFGFTGLLSLKLALVFIFICSLVLSYAYIARDWFVAFLLALLVVCGSSFHMTLRPQLFPWILLPLLIATLEHVNRTKFSATKILGIILIGSLWANNHITTIIGVLSIIFWIPLSLNLIYSLGLFILGSLITPYFGSEWIVFFNKSNHPLTYKLISEFQPATILQFPTAFLIIVFSILILGISYNKDKVYFPRVFFAFFLIAASLAVNKFIPFSLIYSAALIAKYWSFGGEKTFKSFGEGVKKLSMLIDSFPHKGLAFVVLCLAIVNINKLYKVEVDESRIPKKAYDFIEENNLPLPLLNDFGRGGYVLYRKADQKGEVLNKVPIDGRTNVIPDNVWQAYTESFYGKRKWTEFIDLHRPKTILWSMESPFVNLLLASNKWCLAFQQGAGNAGYGVFVEKVSSFNNYCEKEV